MPEEITKPWYQSLTIWGVAIIAIAALLLPLFGKAEVAGTLTETQPDIVATLAKIGEVIGMVLAIIGRFRAKTPIG